MVGLVSRTQPAGLGEVDWFPSLEQVDSTVDLLIDFTLPGGTEAAAHWCTANSVAMVSGTTGLRDADFKALKNAALKAPVLWAPNLSQGVALMTALVSQTADALGKQAEIAIHDIHHKHKLDAPSGTALALAQAARADEGDISFSSAREGEVIGEHTVSFVLADEVIEITHKALDRDVFAKGALKAGLWLVKQAPGYYSTREWLCLGGQ